MWAEPAQAAAHWPDAATLDPEVLLTLLGAAQEVCEAYAPALGASTPGAPALTEDPPGSGLYTSTPGTDIPYAGAIPERYTLAVVLQARELWAAAHRDGDVIGLGDGYALRSRPLTGVVKSLLRPTHGIPGLG